MIPTWLLKQLLTPENIAEAMASLLQKVAEKEKEDNCKYRIVASAKDDKNFQIDLFRKKENESTFFHINSFDKENVHQLIISNLL